METKLIPNGDEDFRIRLSNFLDEKAERIANMMDDRIKMSNNLRLNWRTMHRKVSDQCEVLILYLKKGIHQIRKLLFLGQARLWFLCIYCTFHHICGTLFSWGSLFEEAFINLVDGIWKKMTYNAEFLLGQENTRGIKETTFIDHILYFRKLTQLSLYIWKISAERERE